MRLFHVSETADISVFHPRTPTRGDLDPRAPLVWAIDDRHLPNFLTPRQCPRVTYHVRATTTAQDRALFFSSPTLTHCVVVPHAWLACMMRTTLYLYEFACDDFILQDENAGYYVATRAQMPVARHIVPAPLSALCARGIEFRAVDDLAPLAARVKASSLGYSLCKMANADKPPDAF